jgi:hypothetical protein
VRRHRPGVVPLLIKSTERTAMRRAACDRGRDRTNWPLPASRVRSRRRQATTLASRAAPETVGTPGLLVSPNGCGPPAGSIPAYEPGPAAQES